MRRWDLAVRIALFFGIAGLAYRYMDLLGDSFWSIATGDLLLARLWPLPAQDPFAFTTTAEVWVVHMPLSQLIFALLERAGGLRGLVVVTALIQATAFALLIEPYAKGTLARFVGFVLVSGLILLQTDDLCVRGQVFGDLGLAVLVWLLLQIRSDARVPWWAPVLLGSLWINLHASYFLAIALPLACALLGERRHAASLARFAGLAFLGSFANPYGYRLPLDLVRLLLAKSTAEIDLFGPPNLHDPRVLVAFAVVFAIAFAHGWRRLPGPDALVLVALACAAAVGRRYLPLAGAYAVVVAVRMIRTDDRLPIRVAALAAGLGVGAVGWLTAKDPLRDVPFEEAAIVEREHLPDNVANLYFWGGYLDYAWQGRRKVLVDGRNQLFEDGAFAASQRLAHADHPIETLTAYRINTVIWERGSALDAILRHNPAWRLVHEGPIAVLYTRVAPVKVAPP